MCWPSLRTSSPEWLCNKWAAWVPASSSVSSNKFLPLCSLFNIKQCHLQFRVLYFIYSTRDNLILFSGSIFFQAFWFGPCCDPKTWMIRTAHKHPVCCLYRTASAAVFLRCCTEPELRKNKDEGPNECKKARPNELKFCISNAIIFPV
jgi:hypothetical protein